MYDQVNVVFVHTVQDIHGVRINNILKVEKYKNRKCKGHNQRRVFPYASLKVGKCQSAQTHLSLTSHGSKQFHNLFIKDFSVPHAVQPALYLSVRKHIDLLCVACRVGVMCHHQDRSPP